MSGPASPASLEGAGPEGAGPAGTVPEATRAITRGTARLFVALDCGVVTEFTLKGGRRADVIAVDPRGHIHIAEIKATVADFRGDRKWGDYVEHCDYFYFAVAADFPRAILPDAAACGLIVADRFGAEILRPPPARPLAPARRKALTLRIARTASARLQSLLDPPL